jgi:uncharacterized protein (TIGR03435 family)
MPLLQRVILSRPICAAALIFCDMSRGPGQDFTVPAFEVASIRRVRPNSDNRPQRFNLFPQFTAQNSTLKDLFLLAYDVQDFQVSGGPAWFNSDRYDISAKMAGTPVPGRDAMMLQRRRLQLLLQDRFKLAIHHETRELPVYELTVLKGGSRLRAPSCTESDPKNPGPAPGKTIMDYCGSSGFFKGRFEASSATIGDLVKALANLLDRNVVDKTGISGTFRVVLIFATDDNTIRFPDAPIGVDNPTANDVAPNIFTAVQEQLGLRLESSRGPVEVMVIDHAEKPSEN